jgi:multidrug efflux pump subunit AcrA (membrane-fusion protein)
VIEKIQVEEGDRVSQGQALAILKGIALQEADVARYRSQGQQEGRPADGPVADADARIVECEIRLDEPDLAAGLTSLRVDVLIEP